MFCFIVYISLLLTFMAFSCFESQSFARLWKVMNVSFLTFMLLPYLFGQSFSQDATTELSSETTTEASTESLSTTQTSPPATTNPKWPDIDHVTNRSYLIAMKMFDVSHKLLKQNLATVIKKNYVLSPISISSTLQTILLGASGSTFDEQITL